MLSCERRWSNPCPYQWCCNWAVKHWEMNFLANGATFLLLLSLGSLTFCQTNITGLLFSFLSWNLKWEWTLSQDWWLRVVMGGSQRLSFGQKCRRRSTIQNPHLRRCENTNNIKNCPRNNLSTFKQSHNLQCREKNLYNFWAGPLQSALIPRRALWPHPGCPHWQSHYCLLRKKVLE